MTKTYSLGKPPIHVGACLKHVFRPNLASQLRSFRVSNLGHCDLFEI
jgi:hypothetical protein